MTRDHRLEYATIDIHITAVGGGTLRCDPFIQFHRSALHANPSAFVNISNDPQIIPKLNWPPTLPSHECKKRVGGHSANGGSMQVHKALYPGEKGARKKRGHVPNRGLKCEHCMLWFALDLHFYPLGIGFGAKRCEWDFLRIINLMTCTCFQTNRTIWLVPSPSES